MGGVHPGERPLGGMARLARHSAACGASQNWAASVEPLSAVVEDCRGRAMNMQCKKQAMFSKATEAGVGGRVSARLLCIFPLNRTWPCETTSLTASK